MLTLTVIVVGAVTGVAGLIWAIGHLSRSTQGPIVEGTTFSAQDGYLALEPRLRGMIGLEGVATTDLRPSGIIAVGDERVDAQTRGELIPKGSAVRIVGIQDNFLVVTKIQAPELKA